MQTLKDPNQDRQNVGHDVDPNHFKLWIFMKEIFKKLILKKKSADDNKKNWKITQCAKCFTVNTLAASQRIANIYEQRHDISNNVVCATIKASDQPAHMHSLIRAFACRLNIL